ncbi:MAG TPA: integrin alpha, partial [Phnomibacter sp.]|nr:integrin alpha [Phnomibacter sp.]
SAYFGSSLASAAAVNSDGYSDVIVGAFGYNYTGRAFIYFGSPGGLSSTPNQVLDGTTPGEGFGVSVATAGDVNHDGYSDVVIGAYAYDDGGNVDEGRAFVYLGSSSGSITTDPTIISDANQAYAFFGFSVSSAGDINGDGYSDIIIGSYGSDNGANPDQGKAFIYYGSCTGISTAADLVITGTDQPNDHFGFSVATAGDMNGDGFSDVLVGAFGYNSQSGRAYAFYGSGGGLSTTPFVLENSIAGNGTGDRMGMGVSSAGDINGDGYSDIIVGVPQYANLVSTAPKGRAFVYLGNATGVSATPEIIITDNINDQQFFGHAVGAAGDINGDGFSDIVVGGYKGSWSGFGMAWIFNGNSKGLRNNVRLYDANLSTPMTRSNITDPVQFGAGLYARSFLGKQKGKLVWQTISNGNTFSGNPIANSTQYTSQQGSYTDLGLAGVELKAIIAKAAAPSNTVTRLRVKYDHLTSITGQVYGPWRYPEGYQRGSRAIADVAMNAAIVFLGRDTLVCFASPYTIDPAIGNATSYTWQDGSTAPTLIATGPGSYWVDIVLGGCTYRDSIILTGVVPLFQDLDPRICQGQMYTAPSGKIFNTAGLFKDTLRSAGGCDSVVYDIELTIHTNSVQASNVSICSGRSYTLPWGTVVTTPGIYRDTLKYTGTNCDSIYRIVDLRIQNP